MGCKSASPTVVHQRIATVWAVCLVAVGKRSTVPVQKREQCECLTGLSNRKQMDACGNGLNAYVWW